MRRTSMQVAPALPYPIYNKWFPEFSPAHPSVQINYQSIGSGGGASARSPWNPRFRCDGRAHDRRADSAGEGEGGALPTVLGAVVPIYNIPVARGCISPAT